ncbi:MAG: CCDC90 family protein [Gallionellaceae bacterium]|nr:CCDC90 family protein [Gallionellaceae bacterium]
MSTVTFDTLKFVKTLEASGIENNQAEAIAAAYRDAANDQQLVTKIDLQLELAPIKAELQVMKWMSGLILGGIIALILKSFF